jgi:thiol-disulfide isomerase/thioredoxin
MLDSGIAFAHRTTVFLALLGVAVAGSGCRRANDSSQTQPAPGTAATTDEVSKGEENAGWTLVDNRRMKLSDYRGQAVLLDFYATWCIPCRAEAPHLVALQKRYGGEGLRIIGLNVGGPDDRKEVPAFVKEFGIEYPQAFPDEELEQSYIGDYDAIPQSFVFDRNGRLVKRFIGYDRSFDSQIERAVQASLASRAE